MEQNQSKQSLGIEPGAQSIRFSVCVCAGELKLGGGGGETMPCKGSEAG
jgi:hypothetical protein